MKTCEKQAILTHVLMAPDGFSQKAGATGRLLIFFGRASNPCFCKCGDGSRLRLFFQSPLAQCVAASRGTGKAGGATASGSSHAKTCVGVAPLVVSENYVHASPRISAMFI